MIRDESFKDFIPVFSDNYSVMVVFIFVSIPRSILTPIPIFVVLSMALEIFLFNLQKATICVKQFHEKDIQLQKCIKTIANHFKDR